MLDAPVVNAVYLVAAVLFVLDLRWMAHPRTAARGNRAGALAMLLAVVATLLGPHFRLADGQGLGWELVVVGLAVGTAIGAVAALRVKMTAMPEMVGLFNGFGGAASVLVAAAAIVEATSRLGEDAALDAQLAVAIVASALIGSVTFFGSYVAFGKLAELLAVRWKLKPWQRVVKYGFVSLLVGGAVAYAWTERFDPWTLVVVAAALLMSAILLSRRDGFPFLDPLKMVSAAGSLLLAVLVVRDPGELPLLWALVAVSGLLGVCLTFSIGGADMPVVIALLNSYSGLAAAATGFVIDNTVLIISGSLVGASGILLTTIMCRAMNRSLANVMFKALGPSAGGPSADEVYQNVKSTSAEELALMLETARRVVIVPGYGMAVAQAQHAVRDLANLLESRFGTRVEYAVHPVAGRMPGHMNVLLAEANVPYDKLKELDETNAEIETVDLCIVVGANDVVNPVARTDPDSPIAGMPILDVDRARLVVVVKRSLSPGFAGIPNPLFALDNTLMFFSDAKKAFTEIIAAVKQT